MLTVRAEANRAYDESFRQEVPLVTLHLVEWGESLTHIYGSDSEAKASAAHLNRHAPAFQNCRYVVVGGRKVPDIEFDKILNRVGWLPRINTSRKKR